MFDTRELRGGLFWVTSSQHTSKTNTQRWATTRSLNLSNSLAFIIKLVYTLSSLVTHTTFKLVVQWSKIVKHLFIHSFIQQDIFQVSQGWNSKVSTHVFKLTLPRKCSDYYVMGWGDVCSFDNNWPIRTAVIPYHPPAYCSSMWFPRLRWETVVLYRDEPVFSQTLWHLNPTVWPLNQHMFTWSHCNKSKAKQKPTISTACHIMFVGCLENLMGA